MTFYFINVTKEFPFMEFILLETTESDIYYRFSGYKYMSLNLQF